ncbi:hypothetical protein ABZW30_29740 [Kitasatospora sp. NPDC004669]|uniref:hypothetical protein n=1 Tax=Kitasatospora sp. NPDC004669 TaxID=3154555 RepID=UPI0033B919A3
MGRKKPGKPRRERAAAEYTLQQLQPPGYDQWMAPADIDPDRLAGDPRVSPETVDMMRRAIRLRPRYGLRIPAQALALDLAIDHGVLPLRHPDGSLSPLSVDVLAGLLAEPHADHDLRDTLHELHADGAILLESNDEDEVVLRLVVGKPSRPGEPWLFDGDMESELVPQTCIPVDPLSMDSQEFAALAYLRARLSSGTVGTAEEYATFNGVGSVARAQELFDAVAHLVDVRGCPACPSAHLCTRTD